jgi:hypothetical protein
MADYQLPYSGELQPPTTTPYITNFQDNLVKSLQPAPAQGFLANPANVDMLVQLLGGAGQTVLSKGNPVQQGIGGVGGLFAGAGQARTTARHEQMSKLADIGLSPSDSKVTLDNKGITLKMTPEDYGRYFGEGGARPPR